MDPNKTLSLPFLSPITPQIIPPINKPHICQLITEVLAAMTSFFTARLTPNAARLGSLTIVNKSKS